MVWPTVDPSIEIYPMPSFPTLELSDVDASAKWYIDVLGFQHIATLPGPGGQPAIAQVRWAKYADILLAPGRPSPSVPRGQGVTFYFALSENEIDALAEKARAAGAAILDGPVDQLWNVRTVTIADPDGYRLQFGFGPLKQMSWEDLGQQLRGKSAES